ncbi:methyltransferase domain-containing protein [Primorskyibacter sedentarius]|uniref:methyltransferase domain-containing protein n=1 Tax=Primorskyibacter sedentarius TaxID=745311 RepID=UPI003EB918E5
MHVESYEHMEAAFTQHLAPMGPGKVLEIGSKSRKAEYRRLFESHGWTFSGADLGEGPNVTDVLEDPFRFPFEDDAFDAIISGQMLEHNAMFWLTFMEMSRVLRMGGIMVHIAPSRGPEHRAPQDCWRFYRDGMHALAEWCGMEILQASTDWSRADLDRKSQHRPRTARRMERDARFLDSDWGDTIGVFRKTVETKQSKGADYIRQFAALYEEKPSPRKRTTKAKAKTSA